MNLLLLNTPATGGKLEQALEKLIDFGMDAGKDILIAILIYVIGRFIIRQISALVARILEKRKIETSVQTFLKSLIKILLNMILAFAIIGKLGVETTSFAALLASAGVAVGMALRKPVQLCRRTDYTDFQAVQGRRLHRRTGNKRHDKGNTDFPHHTVHPRQPYDLCAQRKPQRQCRHQLQQAGQAPCRMGVRRRVRRGCEASKSRAATHHQCRQPHIGHPRSSHRLRFTERKQRRYHGTRMGKKRRLLECTVRYQRNRLPDIQ